jgi:DMSO/TMAO reductase YedYZ molybdopterin-dependent catalytic subunit
MLGPVVAGGLAVALMLLVMALLRLTLQVRTIPERIMEAVLLVLPPDAFDLALKWYGFDAKRYALLLTTAAMVLVLTAVGARAVARRWPTWRLVVLGLGLWLAVMVVIMPLTDAGPFGLDIVNGTKAAVAGHLAIALTYAAVLALTGAYGTHWLSLAAPTARPSSSPKRRRAFAPVRTSPRRSALILSTGALSALFGTFALARWGPKSQLAMVVVKESPTTVPFTSSAATPQIAGAPAATATPTVVAPPATVAERPIAPAPAATPTAPVQPTATPRPSLAEQFQPAPLRRLTRDSDGAVLASGRRPGQLAEAITATDDFYVVSKNAVQDPQLSPDEWRLRVDGEVQRPIQIDYRSLRNLPPIDTVKTLECISNFVTKCELVPFGCDLISTAHWKGARLRDVLALAGGLKPGVSALLAIAADDFTTTLPIEVVMDPDTLLVYEMNGRPLAREHGYPARVLVPGRYGMKNAKWVVALRPLGREPEDWYGQRNWTRHAVVKTMTRIDVPARDANLPPGTHRMAGIAYAGDRGIQQVEVSVDGGVGWRPAEIVDRPHGRDVWVRWESSFTLPAATTLTLMARATDGAGDLQVEPFSLPQPDGSSGWHSLDVRAGEV